MPRKGILIRLFIYLPLIAFFGWQAYRTQCASEPPRLEKEAVPSKAFPEGTRRTKTLPDGSKIEYIELTPEQAREALGDEAFADHLDANEGNSAAETPSKAPAEEASSEAEPAEAKAPDSPPED